MTEREKLITDNLDVVKWVILGHIRVNEQVQGLGYDDLYQVGCLALCEATGTYDGSVKFKTYARTFVCNRLIDHFRRISRIQNKTCYLENPMPDSDESAYSDLLADPDNKSEDAVFSQELGALLQKAKRKYSGVTLKGIEAIEMKIKGYSGVEIAALYGVKPNLLGAWISRARQRLRADEEFSAALSGYC